ncbi:MAG: phosphatase PAP2 family protein [Dehalococcoidia bacterium]
MQAVLTASNRPYLAAVVLLSLFLTLGIYAWSVDHAAWEVEVVRWLQDSGAPGLRPVSIGLAVAGTGLPWAVLVGLIGLALLLLHGLRVAALLLVTALLQDVGAVLKLLIGRARPSDGTVEVWNQVTSYSFPSGHTLGATLVFGFLILALEHTGLTPAIKRTLQGVCLLWIVLMGVGRMTLGAHWPTDVLGAYLIGAFLLLPIAALLRRTASATIS